MYLVLFLDEIGGNLILSDYYSAAPLAKPKTKHWSKCRDGADNCREFLLNLPIHGTHGPFPTRQNESLWPKPLSHRRESCFGWTIVPSWRQLPWIVVVDCFYRWNEISFVPANCWVRLWRPLMRDTALPMRWIPFRIKEFPVSFHVSPTDG